MHVDLLIEGGHIVDGSGEPGFAGAIGITGDRLGILTGDTRAVSATRRIDAAGKVVAPGFIDPHSHTGLLVLDEPGNSAKVRQGVTTELVGVDGNSHAPFARREDQLAFLELDAGIDGRPREDPAWRSVADYLRRVDGRIATNLAMVVGNSALRIGALGWADGPADAAATERMRGILREAMGDGAFGISTGLDYPPGAWATTEELAALAEEAGRAGGIYHTHVRYGLGDRFLDPFREAIEIGRRSGTPVHITHLSHRASYPGTPQDQLALVESARAEGLDVTWDTYPAEWTATKLLIQLPHWMFVGGPEALKTRLADRTVRARVRRELETTHSAGSSAWDALRLGGFQTPDLLRWEGRTMAAVMADTGWDAVDAICELSLAEDLRLSQVAAGAWFGGFVPFLVHPLGMVGTDSTFVGEKLSVRSYGTYPRILGELVRDRGLLPIEDAVRKMTSVPAARLGLTERGLLRDGMLADVVVFDPTTVRSNATYDEPRRYPDGIDWVIVNGVPVVEAGVQQAATPGRALRRGR